MAGTGPAACSVSYAEFAWFDSTARYLTWVAQFG